MRLLRTLMLTALLACMASAGWAQPTSPFSGTYTVGTGGDWPILTDAVDSLTDGANTLTGDVTLNIIGAYGGGTDTYPIMLDGFNSTGGPWTITIQRASGETGAAVFPSTNSDANFKITSNGWRFDGRPGGSGTSRLIIIRNSNTSGTGDGIEIIGNASNIILRYLNIESRCTNVGGGNLAILGDSTGGCNNILITGCLFNRQSTNPPVNHIYVNGHSSTPNRDIEISNNDFRSFTRSAIQVTGTGNGDNFLISGNFMTSQLSDVSTQQIVIDFVPENSGGHVISGNIIGQALSNVFINSSASTFFGIRVIANTELVNDDDVDLIVSGNTVKNIQLTNTGNATNDVAFFGIYVEGGGDGTSSGKLKITGNTVGYPTTTLANLDWLILSRLNGAHYGIWVHEDFNSEIEITENQVGGIGALDDETTKHTDRDETKIFGIVCGGTRNNTRIDNNTVKVLYLENSSTAMTASRNPIDYSATAGIVFIPNGNTVDHQIKKNTVANVWHLLSADWGSGGPTSAAVGIAVGTEDDDFLNHNTLVVNNGLIGIGNLDDGYTSSNVQSNWGIAISAGNNSTYMNNMVSLDIELSNDGGNFEIFGIIDRNGGNRDIYVYHNTVVVARARGIGNSAAYNRTENSDVEIKNNIFHNDNSSLASDWHVGIANTYTGTLTDGWGSEACNYNAILVTEDDYCGLWGGTTTLDFDDWKTASSGDRDSWFYDVADLLALSVDNPFVAQNNLHLANAQSAWICYGKAVVLPGAPLTTDFDGQARYTAAGRGNDIGADQLYTNTSVPGTRVSLYNDSTTSGHQPFSISQAISGTGIVYFEMGGRIIASVDVSSLGSISNIAVQYFSGTVPYTANQPNNPNYADGFYRVSVTGTGGSYIPYFEYDTNLLNNVSSNSAEWVLSSSPLSCSRRSWNLYDRSTTNITTAVNTTDRMIGLNGGVEPGANYIVSDYVNPLVLPWQNGYTVAGSNVTLKWVREYATSAYLGGNYSVQYRPSGGSTTTVSGITTCLAENCSTVVSLSSGSYEWRLSWNCSGFSTYGPWQPFTAKTATVLEDMKSLLVYPNPARDYVTVRMDEIGDQTVNIAVVDVLGREVFRSDVLTEAGNLYYSLPIESFTAGLYIIKVAGADFNLTQNLVVTK